MGSQVAPGHQGAGGSKEGQIGHKQQSLAPDPRTTEPTSGQVSQAASQTWGIGGGGGRAGRSVPYQVTFYEDLQFLSEPRKLARTLKSTGTQTRALSSRDVRTKWRKPNESRPGPAPPSSPRCCFCSAQSLDDIQRWNTLPARLLEPRDLLRTPPVTLDDAPPTPGRPQAPSQLIGSCS